MSHISTPTLWARFQLQNLYYADDVREKEHSLINRLRVEFTTLATKNDLLIYQLRTFKMKVNESE